MVGNTSVVEQPFPHSVARLRVEGPEGRVIGAGFLVDATRVVTSAHVIRGIEDADLWVEFPAAETEGGRCPAVAGRVVPESVDSSLDCALVKVDKALSVALLPLRRAMGDFDHAERWTTFGFPEGYPDGAMGHGRPLGVVGNQVQLSDANSITRGFSGAPLVDPAGFVVAMARAISGRDPQGRQTEEAFAVPMASILDRYGLTRAQPECPYPGLMPYTEQDSGWYFGRDAAIDMVVSALVSGPRVQLLMGPSGSGKSSLVAAGLFPRIKKGVVPERAGWTCVRVTAADGTESVMSALAASRTERCLVVIDQFEQFLLDAAADARLTAEGQREGVAPRQASVCSTVQGIVGEVIVGQVLLVVRSDFFPLVESQLSTLRLPESMIHLAGVLTEAEARSVIEGPARSVGWYVTRALRDRIIRDLMGPASTVRPTNLPLLALHLRALWLHVPAGDNVLTHESVVAKRGVLKAFASECDDGLRKLTSAELDTAREILLDLVQPADSSKGTPAIRRRRSVKVLKETHAGAADVITKLLELRVITAHHAESQNEPIAELVHDSLIENSELLRGWLAKNDRLRAWRERIDPRAEAWDRQEKSGHSAKSDPPRVDLLSGNELAEAQEWRASTRIPPATRAYLNESFDRAWRKKRRRQRAAVAGVILTVTSVLLGAVALVQRAEAIDNAQTATANSLAARSMALVDTDPAAAQVFALAALQLKPTVTAMTAARSAVTTPMYPLLSLLSGHTSDVRSVMFSPDSQRVATASEDGTARLWDASSGKELAILRGHTESVESVVFSRDGRRVATASEDGTARLWDASSGKELAILRGHTESVESVVFSRDGRRVVTASEDGTARLWDASSGKGLAVLRARSSLVNAVVLSPGGGRVATASGGRFPQVWDVTSGKVVAELIGYVGGVVSMGLSPDGRRVAIASPNYVARVWDADSGQLVTELLGHTGAVGSVVFSPGGGRVATASEDGTGRVWDAASGKEVAVLLGHTGAVGSVVFSPDGRRLATASEDGTGRVWEVGSGKEVTVLRGGTESVESVVFSPNGKRVTTVSSDENVLVWDLASGQVVDGLHGHIDKVGSVASSSDGRRVATGSVDGAGRVWNAASSGRVTVLRGHTGSVRSVVFSPDGRRVATASWDKTGRVWDADSGKEITVLRGHSGGVVSVVFSPDGRRVATASWDKTGRVWDADSGTVVGKLRGHTEPVESVVFSRDGRRVATASEDGTARVWNAASGREMVVLRGHTEKVVSVVFSPDGTRVATASGDGTGRVWDVDSGQEIMTLRGHSGGVVSVVFSSDGRQVATASQDGTARVHFNVDPAQWPELLFSRTSRNLTLSEWREYRSSQPYERQCDRWPAGTEAPDNAPVASPPSWRW